MTHVKTPDVSEAEAGMWTSWERAPWETTSNGVTVWRHMHVIATCPLHAAGYRGIASLHLDHPPGD